MNFAQIGMDIESKLNRRKTVRDSIYFDCPFCDDSKGHLNIHPAKRVYRCNRCGEGGTLNTLRKKLNLPRASVPAFRPARKAQAAFARKSANRRKRGKIEKQASHLSESLTLDRTFHEPLVLLYIPYRKA